ncbi:interferon regulatory factor 9 isoform X1 [Notamacropus eugenii]|uniref:interferon regulatory factor 9 isoform X1 n=2 Tax=Notamacropus eugenii TaxID=9315 RepID=UPI003B66DA4B
MRKRQFVPSRMASGRARSTRKLRNWVLEQVESGKFPGVCWDDADKTMFRIPWKHAGKQDFREEQDAAFFKAWAIFKGKYREGDQADPAAWKTRLRCALNKSPEFEEVPERGHMEGPEPYKVYRLLPSGTLPGDYCPPCSPVPILGNNISHTLREGWNEFGESDSSFPKAEPSDPFLIPTPGPDSSGASTAPQAIQKLQPKRKHTLLSSEEEDNVESKRSCIPNLPSLQNTLGIMVPSEGPSSSFQNMDDSGIGSNSNSPEPHEVADSTDVTLAADGEIHQSPYLSDADCFLLLTFHYSGHLVGKTEVHGPDCRLIAKPSGTQNSIEQVMLPSASVLSEPALQLSTENLLKHFDRGILVASNSRGLFVQRLCTIPISWTGPCTPSGPGPHLLQDKICVEVFNSAKFFQDGAGLCSIPAVNWTCRSGVFCSLGICYTHLPPPFL